jgi:hypothetical protein
VYGTRQSKWTFEKWSGDGEKAGNVNRQTPKEQGEEPTLVDVVTVCAVNRRFISLSDYQFQTILFSPLCLKKNHYQDSRRSYVSSTINTLLKWSCAARSSNRSVHQNVKD